jgi:hypothetical protein
VGGGQGDAENVPGVAGVDQTVVTDPGCREVGLLLCLDLGLDLLATFFVRRLVEGSPRDSAACRAMIDITPASWVGPITATLWLG